MVHLVDTLVREQHSLVIRPQETSSKRPLSERDGAALDIQTGLDAVFDLVLRDILARWEQLRCD